MSVPSGEPCGAVNGSGELHANSPRTAKGLREGSVNYPAYHVSSHPRRRAFAPHHARGLRSRPNALAHTREHQFDNRSHAH
eukprot:461517-Pyramimonas_sp.AAC.1